MAHVKGTPKTGGRKAGTPNKTTALLKDCISNIVNDYVQPENVRTKAPTLQKDFPNLTAAERVKAIIALSNFVLPKQQAISIDEQKQIETEALTEWLKTAPQEAIDGIAAKILELQQLNGGTASA